MKRTSIPWWQHDKLAPIQKVSEMFVPSFRQAYIPNNYSTADEQIIPFHGQWPFMQ
jgi:hypothetical protein